MPNLVHVSLVNGVKALVGFLYGHYLHYKGNSEYFDVSNKSIEKKLFRNPSLHFGEGYMNKEIIIEEGSIEELIDLVTSCYDDFIQHNSIYKIYENFSGYFKIFQQLNAIVKSKQNVAHHYDLKEDLYKLFLDKDMQYSCAYFHNENMSLDQAQIDKKNHIINKLQISENMKVLDIGCGWGGMAIEIAKQTAVRIKELTEEMVAEEQEYLEGMQQDPLVTLKKEELGLRAEELELRAQKDGEKQGLDEEKFIVDTIQEQQKIDNADKHATIREGIQLTKVMEPSKLRNKY